MNSNYHKSKNFLHHILYKRRSGWGVNLYRDTSHRRIAGIASGVAEQLDIARWVVRIIFVSALLFTGSLAFWAYIIAWLMIIPKQDKDSFEQSMEYNEYYREYRPRHLFRYAESPQDRLHNLESRVKVASESLASMESYVTSRQYQLRQEFSRLKD